MNDAAVIDEESLRTRLSNVSLSQLAIFLTTIAFELTLIARDTYEVQSIQVKDPVRLRAVNEWMHFIVGILRTILTKAEVDISSLAKSLISLQSEQAGTDFQKALRRGLLALSI